MTAMSFQLYSARDYPSFEDFLVQLSALGYSQVEGYSGLYTDPDALAASLKKNGLTMPTAHFSLDELADARTTLRTASVLGVENIYCPSVGLEGRSADESKWLELGEKLAKFGDTYSREGYALGWHNHDFEFKPTISGRTPMEIILETAPDIGWECDVAWIVRGSADPVAWFDRYGARITSVHVKDICPAGECLDEDGWADVGQGVMDWDNLIAELSRKTAAKYFVAEHDKPSDAVRFARRSIETSRKWK